ncbi:Zona pellucida-like domain [Nesidiocoris tenuis]|uniref:Zona pellucida-like domain n=1 Tax=Nesidiocoris tenuis TaxID=355587 RepID=A0ABN7B2X0_9HEMI|nr:Zona pellucida-like domain [Nesidiocoris tenuis]
MRRHITHIWILTALFSSALAKAQYKVKCYEDSMVAELRRTDDVSAIYLEGLKYFPDPACKPVLVEHQAIFKLSLTDIFQCGVTRITNQATDFKTFYHRIVIERDNDEPKEVVQIKCTQGANHTLVKRNVLPAGFQEPINLDITQTVVKEAPQPKLQVGVRQGGEIVSGELNVNPGTPLQMEIYLDKTSAPIYGLLVSYMEVSDTKKQEETIIFNGCSVDPYLFENFNTVDGDFLAAKFRAFKFPDSTYVQFKGTVNVCLDKCRGVECSNGQIGYGRRKRAVPMMPPDPNKVFEVSISSYIKVDYKGDSLLEKVKLDLGSQPVQLLDSNGTTVREVDGRDKLKLDGETLREDLLYTFVEHTSRGQAHAPCAIIITLLLAIAAVRFSS